METYLVRIWESAQPDAPCGEVRGFVQRVRDGSREPFVGVGQLLERLEIQAAGSGLRLADRPPRPGGEGGEG